MAAGKPQPNSTRRSPRRLPRRSLRRAVALLCASTLLGASAPMAASAQTPETSAWGLESERLNRQGPLEVSIVQVRPQLARLGQQVQLQVRVSNPSQQPVGNIVVRLQRSGALASSNSALGALSSPEATFDVATAFATPFSLNPGQSRDLNVAVPISATTPEGLDISEPGTYPLLVNVNGRPDGDIDQLLAETRTLLPVLGSPSGSRGAQASEATDDTAGNPNDTDAPETDAEAVSEEEARTSRTSEPAAVPLSLLWPISAPVPIVGGETGDAPAPPHLIMSNESLAEALAPGGRLDNVLSSLEDAFAAGGGEQLRQATCLAIDPETLEAVARMSGGFYLGDRRPSPVQGTQRLRDSWGSQNDADLTEVAGSEDATQWLERLRLLSERTCTLALPWAGADMSAIAAIGDENLSMEALIAGPQVISQHLNTSPLRGVYLPAEGFLTSASAPLYARATEQLPLGADGAFERRLQEPLPTSAGAAAATTTLVAANTLIDDTGQPLRPGGSGVLPDGSRAFGLPSSLTSALAASGHAPQTLASSERATRFDFRLDSGPARIQTATALLHQELVDAAAGESTPVVAAPPVGWSPSAYDATTLLNAVTEQLRSGRAASVALPEALNLSATRADAGALRTIPEFADPAPVPETALAQARRSAREITDLTTVMANDPRVALSRYGFTQPLRRDLLRATTVMGRRSLGVSHSAAQRSAYYQDAVAAMVRQLRQSVSLIAPGGVYTRTTELAPIVVVARNGLPLPVPGYVRIATGESVNDEKFAADIPAKGSVTVHIATSSVTAALRPAAREDAQTRASLRRQKLSMWLESESGQPISRSVSVSLQPGIPVGVLLVGTVVIVIIGGYFAAKRTGAFRK